MRKHEIRGKHKNLHRILGGGSQCFPPTADDAFRLKSIPLELKTFLFLLNSLSLTFIFRKLFFYFQETDLSSFSFFNKSFELPAWPLA